MQVLRAIGRQLQIGGCQKAPPGWVKLNFDGSFNQSTGKAGIGGIICDPYGNMIMALSAEVLAKFPLEAELLALQRGIAQVKELDWMSQTFKLREIVLL